MASQTSVDVSVFSEISQLREVLVHSPGVEVDVMPPSLMSELLFDDIIYGPRARREHRQFRSILEKLGVVVRDQQQLLEEAITASKDHIPELVTEVSVREGLEESLSRELLEMSPRDLAAALVEGILVSPEHMHPDHLFRLFPLPNLLFSRDAQVVIGEDIVIAGMSRKARRREPVLSRFVFRHHPSLHSERVLVDFPRLRSTNGASNAVPSFEGGDVLIFGEGIVIIGVSERTMEVSVNILTESLRNHEIFHTLIMVPMPRHRTVMHLDTIFTRSSEDECLAYGPMIASGNDETLSAISIDLRNSHDWGTRHPSLLDALKKQRVDLNPIYCGSSGDYIQQSREQWTDGANSFAIAPGVILLYSRNEATADALAAKGYEVIASSRMTFTEDWRCLYHFEPGKKYAILVCGEELSRARGGPRCMTMPLRRDEI